MCCDGWLIIGAYAAMVCWLLEREKILWHFWSQPVGSPELWTPCTPSSSLSSACTSPVTSACGLALQLCFVEHVSITASTATRVWSKLKNTWKLQDLTSHLAFKNPYIHPNHISSCSDFLTFLSNKVSSSSFRFENQVLTPMQRRAGGGGNRCPILKEVN